MKNKKIFLAMFFIAFFSFFVSFTPFQGAEKMIMSVQAEDEDECIPGRCTCSFLCEPSCAVAPDYVEDSNCIRSTCACAPCGCCSYSVCYDTEWCGDGEKNGDEDCDAYDSDGTPIPTCEVFVIPPITAYSAIDNTVPYDGLFLCDMCDWQYDASDSQICASNTVCAESPADPDCSGVDDGRLCEWDSDPDCTPIDWCGDGIINGPELYCDVSDWGTEDFGGETCESQICDGDIESSQNPGCSALAFDFEGDDGLTCANTCRNIYTVPGCNFPLNATGLDLSDDGQYVFVTDLSLWSLQMFPASTPPDSVANPDKLLAIYYLDSEPLSVDVAGNYAYVGTKGEFSVININQYDQPDRFPDSVPYVFPPFVPKDSPLLPFKEEQLYPITSIPIFTLWGEVNDVHIVGSYAYLAVGTAGATGPAALVIVDISDPFNPSVVGTYTFNTSTLTGAQSVDVSGNYAYVAYTDGSAVPSVGYLEVIDISNKANPSFVKEIDIGTSTSSIDISGDYAFIDGFSTFHSNDIATPSDPSTIHTTDNINLGHEIPPNETFAIDIDDTGDLAYVAVKDIGLMVVDISDPENISEDKIFSAPVDAPIIVDVIIDAAGDYAYAAGLEAGLLIFNLDQDCGNEVLDGFEVCDGLDVGDETCITKDFAEGSLSCSRFCKVSTLDCIECGPADLYCPAGCTNPPDPDCPPCVGVVCGDPGFCEIGPGVCEEDPDVYGNYICVYPDNPNACIAPNFCQVGPGICDKEDGVCRYPDDPEFCDAGDGDICTGDRCVSLDGGISSACLQGSNICGGFVPCGRMVDDPDTPWNDADTCGFCHGIMLLNQGMNFLLEIASMIAVLALIIAGFLFITSAGDPERKNNAKTAFKWTLIGFLILLLAWLIVDFFLSALGYIDPLGGSWNVVC